ncbi:MAG: hypothetical protein WBA74_06780 [Cyclobacteriaceae bacterium]
MDLIETDPILKEEFLFQQSIVGGLREYRKNELKNRLSSISVGIGIVGILMNASSYKLMAAVLTLGFIGYGSYFAITQYTENKEIADSQFIEIADPELMNADHPRTTNIVYLSDATIALIDEKLTSNTEQQANPLISTDELQSASIPVGSTTEKQAKIVGVSTKTEDKVVIPKFSVPDFSDEPMEEDALDGPVIDVANIDNIGISDTEEEKKIEIEQIKKSNKAIQYKFEEGKLYLYGDFNGIPYELLEINAAGKKTLYFYHNKQYYRLDRFQKSVTDFSRINDKKLVKELEIIRTSR